MHSARNLLAQVLNTILGLFLFYLNKSKFQWALARPYAFESLFSISKSKLIMV